MLTTHKQAPMLPCLSCAHTSLDTFPSFARFKRISSDCKPFPEGGELLQCQACDLVQKPTNTQWQQDVSLTYEHYTPYPSTLGREQKTFDPITGIGRSRSDKLCEFIQSQQRLTQITGKVLDYGCGNGVFLSAFSKLWPNWKLYGCDMNRQHEPILHKIPNFIQLYTAHHLPEQIYDCISLVHNLEHLPTPIDTLRQLKNYLSPSGLLFIQVPNLMQSPHDILIVDHAMHFSPHTLSNLLHLAGFSITTLSSHLVTKEITVLAKPAFIPEYNSPDQPESKHTDPIISQHMNYLLHMIEDIQHLEQQGPFAIFGSAIAASWLSHYTKNFICFVDEDSNTWGNTLYNKSILPIDQVPQGIPIYIGLPMSIAKEIQKRYAHTGRSLILPSHTLAHSL